MLVALVLDGYKERVELTLMEVAVLPIMNHIYLHTRGGPILHLRVTRREWHILSEIMHRIDIYVTGASRETNEYLKRFSEQ